MKLFQKKKQNRFYINNREIVITSATFDEMVDVIFTISPYLKAFIAAKVELKAGSAADVYFDVVMNILDHLGRKDFIKTVAILLHQDIEFVETLQFADVVKVIPAIVRENKLSEVFQILRLLGAFD